MDNTDEIIDVGFVYNPYYKLDDGCIYDKDKKAFVTVETNKNSVVI